MKKLIVAFVALALAGAGAQKVNAGGYHGGCGGSSGWEIAAAAIGGLAAGVAVGAAVAPRPAYPAYYAAPAPAYYPAPAPGYGYYYAPAPQPAVVYVAPAPVVYAPVYRAPVYVAPPVVSVRYGYGGHCYRRW